MSPIYAVAVDISDLATWETSNFNISPCMQVYDLKDLIAFIFELNFIVMYCSTRSASGCWWSTAVKAAKAVAALVAVKVRL